MDKMLSDLTGLSFQLNGTWTFDDQPYPIVFTSINSGWSVQVVGDDTQPHTPFATLDDALAQLLSEQFVFTPRM